MVLAILTQILFFIIYRKICSFQYTLQNLVLCLFLSNIVFIMIALQTGGLDLQMF